MQTIKFVASASGSLNGIRINRLLQWNCFEIPTKFRIQFWIANQFYDFKRTNNSTIAWTKSKLFRKIVKKMSITNLQRRTEKKHWKWFVFTFSPKWFFLRWSIARIFSDHDDDSDKPRRLSKRFEIEIEFNIPTRMQRVLPNRYMLPSVQMFVYDVNKWCLFYVCSHVMHGVSLHFKASFTL